MKHQSNRFLAIKGNAVDLVDADGETLVFHNPQGELAMLVTYENQSF